MRSSIARSSYRMYLARLSSSGDAGEARVDDTRRRSRQRFAGALGGVERHVLEQPLHHRIEPARADVLLLLVHGERDLGEPADAVGREVEMHALGGEQRLVLARQAGVGGGQDLLEIGNRQRDNSTRIGKRPCSSGIRSDGFDRWNAPDAMNRM